MKRLLPRYISAPRDANREPSLLSADSITGAADAVTSLSLNSGAIIAPTIALVDGSGNQITSFGGSTTITGPVGQKAMAASVSVAIASDQTAVPVSGTFYQTTQPVSIAAMPSTPVTGTFWQATQPISAVSLPLPAGAATSAKQPALGTAGTASTDVITVQGIASMVALKVDGSAVTQPVSGTVTANIGTTNGVTPVPSAAGATGWQFKQFGDGTVGTNWNGTKQQIAAAAATFGGYVMIFNPNTATSFIQIFNKTAANVTLGTTVPDMVIPIPGVASASATGAAANNELVNGVKFSTGLTVAITTTAGGLTSPVSNCYGCVLYN